MASIYDFTAQTNTGKELSFAELKGKVLLIVNTASKCGFTPQFAGLEKLYQKYRDRGLVVVGFPSGDFANQELADGSQAEEFCRLNYGVSFPIMKKVHVNGSEADPIFKYLKSHTKGFLGSRINGTSPSFSSRTTEIPSSGTPLSQARTNSLRTSRKCSKRLSQ